MFTLAIFCYVMNAFMWNIFRHVRIWYEESTVVGWYHRSQLDWDRNTSSRNLLSTKNMTTPQRGTYRQAGVAVWVGTGPNQQENGVEDAWRQKCFLFMKTEKHQHIHGIIFIHLLSQLHLNLAPAHSAEKIAPDQNILMIKPAWCIDKIGWKILLQYGTWKTMLYHEQLIPCSYKCSLTKNNQGNALSRRACSVMQNANNSSTIIQSIPSMIWVKMYEYSLSQKKHGQHSYRLCTFTGSVLKRLTMYLSGWHPRPSESVLRGDGQSFRRDTMQAP